MRCRQSGPTKAQSTVSKIFYKRFKAEVENVENDQSMENYSSRSNQDDVSFKVPMTLIFLRFYVFTFLRFYVFTLKYKLNKEPRKKYFSNLTRLCIFFRAVKLKKTRIWFTLV
jgi:hypothetical protein